MQDPEAVKDLRQEMESIKKLLLSKDSFPAAVPTQLPSWQIRRHDSEYLCAFYRGVEDFLANPLSALVMVNF